jgi:Lrp/AsnC family transcriptional regulator, leucine-responsive regulatory protein
MMALKEIDYRIIELLQKNARATQSEIAAAVGLSQPAVAERIKKLEQEGLIKEYVARVDARRLGKDITAFIGVGITHPKYNIGFARRILSLPDVLECHHVTGQDSYLLKIVTENTETLDRLISEQIRTIAGVTRTQTTIVMSTVKEVSHIKPSLPESDTRGKRRRKPQ